jgi:hypothetical protein
MGCLALFLLLLAEFSRVLYLLDLSSTITLRAVTPYRELFITRSLEYLLPFRTSSITDDGKDFSVEGTLRRSPE